MCLVPGECKRCQEEAFYEQAVTTFVIPVSKNVTEGLKQARTGSLDKNWKCKCGPGETDKREGSQITSLPRLLKIMMTR